MEHEYFISHSGSIYAKIINNTRFVQVSVRNMHCSISFSTNTMSLEDFHNPVFFSKTTQVRFENAFNEAVARISSMHNFSSALTN